MGSFLSLLLQSTFEPSTLEKKMFLPRSLLFFLLAMSVGEAFLQETPSAQNLGRQMDEKTNIHGQVSHTQGRQMDSSSARCDCQSEAVSRTFPAIDRMSWDYQMPKIHDFLLNTFILVVAKLIGFMVLSPVTSAVEIIGHTIHPFIYQTFGHFLNKDDLVRMMAIRARYQL